jgi:dTDP-4-amino-4,6-dideoxygalactose transaminase
MITFNKPHLCGDELNYIRQAVLGGGISGNGDFTKKCQKLLQEKYGFKKVLLTTSCTDALEMCAMLCDITAGDEVIMPSYTFVSTALAFVRQGAKIVFADSRSDQPDIDADVIEPLITARTKVIVAVHYAGVACDMDKILDIAKRHKLLVVEDAAQAIDSYYKGRPLGSIGDLSTFSFHETKNITSGEGGMVVINNEHFMNRAEILWEKGTNRAQFYRGEVNKYGWMDTGSSFLPSDITAAFLYAQLKSIDDVQTRRKALWNKYYSMLKPLEKSACFTLPVIPDYATLNAHIFYMVCGSLEERTALIAYLKSNGVQAVYHYLSLHKSPFYKDLYNGYDLPCCDRYADCLVRLPLFYDLTFGEIEHVCNCVRTFYAMHILQGTISAAIINSEIK